MPTRDLSRRQCCTRLAALLGGLAASACTTLSPQDERRLGHEEAQEIERTVGLVREGRLVEYIGAIGARLAQVTGRADIAWHWGVADDGDANAFALPGGWVYVTRGLLALSNREDEVAGVLAHEMAHVVERHAVRRVGAATPFAVLFGVPSGVLGMVSPSLGGIVGGAGRVVSGLTLAPYSREQELEADRVGSALAARAGWNPGALAEFLGTLERSETLAGGASRRSSFFATHPSTPDRVAHLEALARAPSSALVGPIAGGRAAFLGRLEGLVIGTNAAHGVFAGPLFLHADFDLALEMPARWKTANRPEAAGAVAPDETAVILLQLVAQGDDPVAGARADALTDAQLARIRRRQIAQLPAAALTASTRDGTHVALTWIAHRRRIFRVTGVCGSSEWARHRDEFERTATSFRPLRPEDQARITESRLRIRSARAGESIAQVLARGGATWTPAQAAVANGVGTERPLEPDWPVKVAVSERYRPSGSPTPAQR
jgi:predicted Zn-dependent protease